MNNCPDCGTPNPPERKLCQKCGARLNERVFSRKTKPKFWNPVVTILMIIVVCLVSVLALNYFGVIHLGEKAPESVLGLNFADNFVLTNVSVSPDQTTATVEGYTEEPYNRSIIKGIYEVSLVIKINYRVTLVNKDGKWIVDKTEIINRQILDMPRR